MAEAGGGDHVVSRGVQDCRGALQGFDPMCQRALAPWQAAAPEAYWWRRCWALFSEAAPEAPSRCHSVRPRGVPASRVYLFGRPAAGLAPVSVRRDSGFVGSGCSADIYVNGQTAARLETGESTTLYVPAGAVILGIKADGVLCDGVCAEQEAVTAPDRILYFRVGLGMGSGMGLFRTNP